MSKITIQSPTSLKVWQILLYALIACVALLRTWVLPIDIIWKIVISFVLLFILIWQMIEPKRSRKKVMIDEQGNIQIGKKTYSIQNYSGVASAYKLKGSTHDGYQIALIPNEMLQPALIVYENTAFLHKKEQSEPNEVAQVRQQIAQAIALQDYGFLGALVDDEWRYLAHNPQSPDLYGSHWKK